MKEVKLDLGSAPLDVPTSDGAAQYLALVGSIRAARRLEYEIDIRIVLDVPTGDPKYLVASAKMLKATPEEMVGPG